MRRRRLHRVAVVILIVIWIVVGTATHRLLTRLHAAGITKSNFERIKQGMSKAEVDSLFAGPPRAEAGKPLNAIGMTTCGSFSMRPTRQYSWVGANGSADIRFTDSEEVIGGMWLSNADNASVLEEIYWELWDRLRSRFE